MKQPNSGCCPTKSLGKNLDPRKHKDLKNLITSKNPIDWGNLTTLGR
jgi:hypothetical protein